MKAMPMKPFGVSLYGYAPFIVQVTALYIDIAGRQRKRFGGPGIFVGNLVGTLRLQNVSFAKYCSGLVGFFKQVYYVQHVCVL